MFSVFSLRSANTKLFSNVSDFLWSLFKWITCSGFWQLVLLCKRACWLDCRRSLIFHVFSEFNSRWNFRGDAIFRPSLGMLPHGPLFGRKHCIYTCSSVHLILQKQSRLSIRNGKQKKKENCCETLSIVQVLVDKKVRCKRSVRVFTCNHFCAAIAQFLPVVVEQVWRGHRCFLCQNPRTRFLDNSWNWAWWATWVKNFTDVSGEHLNSVMLRWQLTTDDHFHLHSRDKIPTVSSAPWCVELATNKPKRCSLPAKWQNGHGLFGFFLCLFLYFGGVKTTQGSCEVCRTEVFERSFFFPFFLSKALFHMINKSTDLHRVLVYVFKWKPNTETVVKQKKPDYWWTNWPNE